MPNRVSDDAEMRNEGRRNDSDGVAQLEENSDTDSFYEFLLMRSGVIHD